MIVRMRKPLNVAVDGVGFVTRYYKKDDEPNLPDPTALALIKQGFAEAVDKVAMVRTVTPSESAGYEGNSGLGEFEEKAEAEAPENKDEGTAPKNKMRVYELAKQLGVDSADILLKAVEVGIKGITKAAHAIDEDQAARIIRAFD